MKKPHSFLVGFFLTFLFIPAIAWGQKISGKVEIHFIDVGQADAILIISPNRECVMLIYSGDTRYPGSSKNFKQYIQDKLSLGSKIDLVVASHPHSDHIGSMRWVLQNYRVRTFIDNGKAHDSALYRNLIKEVGQQRREKGLKYFPHDQTPAKEQDFCPAENLDTVLLYPEDGYDSAFCEANQNNCSVVVRMTYENTSFLFPGDAEREQEELLLKEPAVREKLRSQVLKAAHHGSDTSSSKDFIETVSPKWFVVSSGKKGVGTNVGYKHPRLSTITTFLRFVGSSGINNRTIDVFDKARAKWSKKSISGNLYVTAQDGSIVLSSDGKEVRRE